MAISSRKQYQQVSDAIRRVRKYRPKHVIQEGRDAGFVSDTLDRDLDKLVNVLCETYAKDNPSFDDARFRRDCGYSS